ncbi:DUF305 domain-containing protein [Massilia scottii]|uniref:DUF305 domain-containing protein n=1 Tax=Massilia scottii TaxID=3057166 RepID=UPI0027966C0B|nr:DUF305 domain-containing protein [Massilia sp. CCM 9029]MDQ1829123.1 DUF305 domain-containing protein [Massilia sp. CCM 9029]
MRYQNSATPCAIAVAIAITAIAPAAARDAHGTTTARFEQQYLIFVIDHHFGALRMAELAAGTEVQRSAAFSPREGTSPTPNFRATVAKAALAEIKSIGRRDNRVQREEILAAQRMLMKWYRLNHTPTLSGDAKRMIAMLERAPAGPEFDKAFLRHMTHHHYQVLGPSVQCAVGAQLEHGELQRYCKGILDAQMTQIDDMRHLLCERYSDCHYQPFRAHDGHAGDIGMEHPVMTD